MARGWDTLGVRGKQVVVSVFVLAVALSVGGGFAERRVERMTMQRIERELERTAATVAVVLGALPHGDLDALADAVGASSGARITLIRGDGVVVGDSEVDGAALARLENHGERPEVVEARRSGRGVARRRSSTLDADLLYLVLPARVGDDDGWVRAALPLVDVDGVLSTVRWLFVLAGAVALAVAVAGAFLASHLVSRRLRDLVARARKVQGQGFSGGGDEVDGLSRTFAALTDELERNLQALVDERDRYDALLHAMSEGVIVLDPDGRVVVANPAAGALLGMRDDAVGARLDLPALQPIVRDARDGRVAEVELELPAGDDRKRLVLVRATPKPAVTSRVAGGVVLVVHDVSEIRRLETLRRDFVANVSHELRTPCSVILANTETLLSGALEDGVRAQKFVEAVHRNAERLSRLIADLLELSKIEAGKVVFARVPVNLRQAVEHVVDAVEPRAREKQISVTVDVDEMLAIEGDPRALDQVLINLIDNAVKYTPAGGHVVVSARGDGGTARLIVEDDGPGVEEKHKERLFERFYRVDPGRSRDVGGTGLGLAIVKHLVEAMDGVVGVEDAVPHGTRFCVTLPAAPSNTAARAA